MILSGAGLGISVKVKGREGRRRRFQGSGGLDEATIEELLKRKVVL